MKISQRKKLVNLKNDLKDHFIKALESYPNYSEAHLQLALIYEKEGDDVNAVKHFKAAILSDLEEADNLENKGDDLIKKYQFQNAKDYFIKSQNKKNHRCTYDGD